MSTLRELVINCQKSRDFDSEPIGSIASVLPWQSSTERWKLMKMKELCARGLEGKCPASHVFCRGNLKTRCELYERSRYWNGHLKIVEKLWKWYGKWLWNIVWKKMMPRLLEPGWEIGGGPDFAVYRATSTRDSKTAKSKMASKYSYAVSVRVEVTR